MRSLRLPDYQGTRRLMACMAGIMLICLAGCGGEESIPPSFTLDNEEGFMAACVDSVADSELMAAVCGCVIEELQSIDYKEFESLDARLVENPEAKLPAAITDVVADCFIEEAEL